MDISILTAGVTVGSVAVTFLSVTYTRHISRRSIAKLRALQEDHDARVIEILRSNERLRDRAFSAEDEAQVYKDTLDAVGVEMKALREELEERRQEIDDLEVELAAMKEGVLAEQKETDLWVNLANALSYAGQVGTPVAELSLPR